MCRRLGARGRDLCRDVVGTECDRCASALRSGSGPTATVASDHDRLGAQVSEHGRVSRLARNTLKARARNVACSTAAVNRDPRPGSLLSL